MTLDEFKNSLKEHDPPSGILPALKSLWYDARGDWNKAHFIAQETDDHTGAWVHGYLHRKEGDLDNARYWYSRAARSMPRHSFEKEWEIIAAHLLKNNQDEKKNI